MFTEILDLVGLLVFGFILLVKGADWFVEGAAGIANKLGVPQLVIGLTIVAMGTSAPETAISLTASFQESAALAVGNIVGSNIMNVLVILGITAIITPLAVQKSTIKYEMPFVIFISVLFPILGLGLGLTKGLAAPDGVLSRIDGIILLLLFVIYLAYLFYMVKHGQAEAEEIPGEKNANWLKLLALLAVGLTLIILGSDYTIRSATKLAKLFGMSERFIGLTIVAFGTSLPELATCIAAGLKKNADIAIGNIVGSNIFNMLFVGGVSAVIKPVTYQGGFFIDSAVCLFTAALLYLSVFFNKKRVLNRFSGTLMIVCYAAYFAYLVMKSGN
ncbi:calcium/sodium antiporter [Treponema zioleckii]|uniref:calcium/sodium antiporter n=1 Tax=Treponema zioleckii TaxID=331680 RepID=UPI00168C0F57|nr:calcium/sodium antiporter [Treponema zioleckii]